MKDNNEEGDELLNLDIPSSSADRMFVELSLETDPGGEESKSLSYKGDGGDDDEEEGKDKSIQLPKSLNDALDQIYQLRQIADRHKLRYRILWQQHTKLKTQMQSGHSDAFQGTPVWRLAATRLSFLLPLAILLSFSSDLLEFFDEILTRWRIVSLYIPCVMGMYGNSGAQILQNASTLHSIPFGQLLKRELLITFIVSAALSMFLFVRVMIGFHTAWVSASVISLCTLCMILLSAVGGMSTVRIVQNSRFPHLVEMTGAALLTFIDLSSIVFLAMGVLFASLFYSSEGG